MIGAALVRECLRAGHEVVVLVPDGLPRLGPLPDDDHLLFLDCDVRKLNEFCVEKVGQADAFFHLAWLGTAPGTRGLLQTQVDNITNALAAVDLANHLGCSIFVGAGSQAECGRVEGALLPETPAFPETGYGIAKLAAGNMTRLACREYGIRHCWARILSVYGPGDNPHTMVMQVIADACHGKAPQCTKGEQLWDYLYCDDCGRALLSIAEQGVDGMVYPVGSGCQRLLREFIADICRACDGDVTPVYGAIPYPDNQVMFLRADTTALRVDTGWEAKVTFEEGIAHTVRWYRENGNG